MIGNGFKQRSVLIVFVVSSIFLLANFVGAATYDASGEWNLSISNGWTDGGDNCPLEEDQTLSATIIQNGDEVTVIVHDGDAEGDITLNGSVNDSNYNLSAFWIEEDGNEVTVSGTFTLSSSTSGTGQMDISITEGIITCNKGMDITLTKQGTAPTYDATGDWDYSDSNSWNTCDPPGPEETGTVTLTQSGNTFTLTTDEGTIDGVVYDATYTTSETYPANAPDGTPGMLTEEIVFTLSSNSAGSGTFTATWVADNINFSCGWGNDFTVTKQVPEPGGGGGGGGG